MIKAAFFDIDNTLYDWEARHFVPSGIKAIKSLQRTGVKVFLCTARPYGSIKDFGVLDLGIKWNGIVANCGGYVALGNRTLRLLTIEHQTLLTLTHIAKKNHLTMEFVTAKTRFLTAPGNTFLDNYHGTYSDVVPPIHPYRGEKVTGVLLFCPEEFDEQFKQVLPDLIYYRFHPYGVDIAQEEHKKGDGISIIMKEFGWKRDEVLSFGDDLQDITMGEASIFVCMGNGHDKAKEAADYVCPRIGDDGLYQALCHYEVLP